MTGFNAPFHCEVLKITASLVRRNEDRIDLIAAAKMALRSRHGRSQFSKQRPGSFTGWKRIADFQIRIREIERKSSREQFWKRSNCRTIANLERDRWRVDA